MTTASTPDARSEPPIPDHAPLLGDGHAVAEALRCLYCADAPCVKACPTEIDVPGFIRRIATGNRKGAARLILDANPLGWSCGRTCPVEVLCAGACVYQAWEKPPIEIGRLQRWATEPFVRAGWHAKAPGPATGRRVACVGAGPASLAIAAQLRFDGHEVVIFEKRAQPGGLNTHGIAVYKLPAEDARIEAEWVRSLGVEFRLGVEVGAMRAGEPSLGAADLVREFDAVFLGVGLGGDGRLGVPGEDLPGVIGATAFIERLKTSGPERSAFVGLRRAVVIGGGNTAVDVVRQLRGVGVPDVSLICRRSESELPAFRHEVDAARHAGVVILDRRRVSAFNRHGASESSPITSVDVLPSDGFGPGAPVPQRIPCDLAVVAVGQDRSAAALALAFSGVALDPRGRIVVDPATHRTGNPRVWAAGDCVNGGREVVNAVAEAKVAARDISRTLGGVSHG